MIVDKKTIRYYYWLIQEFVKKHLKLIILSFFLSFIFIISLISITPYLESYLTTTKRVVGITGVYDLNSVPDEVLNKVTNGLVFVNEKGQVVPVLASRWEVKNQGKEYVIHLKNNLNWADGKKFTAHDINYSFSDVKTQVIDDNTISFILKKPLPIFLTYLTKPIVKYPLEGIAGLYEVNRYKLEFGNVKEIDLSPNKPGIPPILYRFYDNDSTVISAYKKGEINEFTTAKKTVADQFSSWKNSSITKTVDYSRLLTLFFNFNGNALLKEKEIRQAINISFDPTKMIDFGVLANGPIPPVSWAYNPDVQNDPYDIAAARRIIRKSLTSTDSAQLDLVTFYDYLGDAENIADALEDTGFKVNLAVSSSDRPVKFDLLLAFWKVPYDPDQYYFWHSTQKVGNIGSYNNVKIDRLLELGRDNIKIDDRKKIYYDFQRNILDDPPATFLYYPYIYTIKRK